MKNQTDKTTIASLYLQIEELKKETIPRKKIWDKINSLNLDSGDHYILHDFIWYNK